MKDLIKTTIFFSKTFIICIIIIFNNVFNFCLDTNFLNKTLFPIFFIFLISMFLIPFIGVEVKGAKKVVKSLPV